MGSFWIDLAIKTTLILVGAEIVAWRLRRGSAAARHLVWFTGLAAAAALPALSAALPRWRIEVLPVDTALETATGSAAATGGSWASWGLVFWLAGALAVLAPLVLGRVRVWWLERSSERLDLGPWPALTNSLCGEIGLSRAVALRRADQAIVPMTWGVLRPIILLPRDADSWPVALRRDVLLHELAHVKRNDYLIHLIARTACAFHWFHPLAWRAARRLRVERERACDDQVLEAGADAFDYARHLLEVARWRCAPRAAGVALGMGGAALSERLTALLDRRPRRALSRRLTLPLGAAAAGLVLPLAALHPVSRPVPGATTAAAGVAFLDPIASARSVPGPSILGPPPSMNAARGVRRNPEVLRKAEAAPATPERRRDRDIPARPAPLAEPDAARKHAFQVPLIAVSSIDVVIERRTRTRTAAADESDDEDCSEQKSRQTPQESPRESDLIRSQLAFEERDLQVH